MQMDLIRYLLRLPQWVEDAKLLAVPVLAVLLRLAWQVKPIIPLFKGMMAE
jgi:hypothetical protein